MNEKSEQAKSKVALENIKSSFILKKIIDLIKKNKSLEIMKYNKKLQKRLNINIKFIKNILNCIHL